MNELLYAAGGAQQSGANPIMALLPFILIIVVMYLLMIRPQAKKQKEKQKMLQNLQTGDEILTIGGIIGKIEGVKEKENTIIVRISKDVKINLSRAAVAEKIVKK